MDWTGVSQATRDDYERTLSAASEYATRVTACDGSVQILPLLVELYHLLNEEELLREQIEDERTWTPFQRGMRDLQHMAKRFPKVGATIETVRGDQDLLGRLRELGRLARALDADVVVAEREAKGSNLYQGAVRRLRASLGYTKEGFARELGVNPLTVYRWERGSNNPRGKHILRIRKLAREHGLEFRID